MSHHINVIRIKAIAKALQELNQQVVFIGGAVVSLYVENPDKLNLRPTDDIDVIIQLANRGKYFLLQERLREIGFTEDVESQVICRWKIQGIIVDIMPTDPEILGFSNPWYEEGIANKQNHNIDGIEINLLSMPYFLATKLEALFNRDGGVDWRWSSDFEDIIKLVRECDPNDLTKHITNDKLKSNLVKSFTELISKEDYFFEACSAHMISPFYQEQDINIVIQNIKQFILQMT